MLTILIVLLILALVGGFWGTSGPRAATYGYVGWSPLGIILVVAVILYLTGNLRLR